MSEPNTETSLSEDIKALMERVKLLEESRTRNNPTSDVLHGEPRIKKIQRPVYPASNGKRLAVMLVNYFEHTDLKILGRKAAGEKDAKLMERLWKNTLKCEFRVHKNQTAKQMKEILRGVADVKETYDYVVVMISTHGGKYAKSVLKDHEEKNDRQETPKSNYTRLQRSQKKAEENGEDSSTEIFLGDDCVPVCEREIKMYFYNTLETSELHEKPKFLILDYCRGVEMDLGYRKKANPFDERPMTLEITSLLPSVSDMLVAYATHPDFTALEHGGSWLISIIAEVFEKNYVDTDVVTMLTMVNKKMKEKIGTMFNTEERKYLAYKAMSMFESSLDRDFFLLVPPSLEW